METSMQLRGARGLRTKGSVTLVVACLGCAWPAAAQEQLATIPSHAAGGAGVGNPTAEPDTSNLAGWKDYRSPAVARRLSGWFTAGPLLGGLTMVLAAANNHNSAWAKDAAIAGAATLAFGLTLGPSVGYAYSGEHLRAWGVGMLRLAGLTVGTLAVAAGSLSDVYCSDYCSHEDRSGTMLVGVVLVVATLVSAVHDIAKAPDAARRSNARHGLSDLNLVPVVASGGPAAFRGLALAGRF